MVGVVAVSRTWASRCLAPRVAVLWAEAGTRPAPGSARPAPGTAQTNTTPCAQADLGSAPTQSLSS